MIFLAVLNELSWHLFAAIKRVHGHFCGLVDDTHTQSERERNLWTTDTVNASLQCFGLQNHQLSTYDEPQQPVLV